MVMLEEARRVIEAAERNASEIKHPMNIAVVDEGGNLVSHVRMDGAWIGSIDISLTRLTLPVPSIFRRRISRNIHNRAVNSSESRYPTMGA